MKKPMLVSFGQFEKLFENRTPESIRQKIEQGKYGTIEIKSLDVFKNKISLFKNRLMRNL